VITVCGDDGCNGACGICSTGKVCDDTGSCVAASAGGLPGTCDNPIPLVPTGATFLGSHDIQGDTTEGVNVYAPSCNTLSGAKELMYTFTVPEGDYDYVGGIFTLSGDAPSMQDTVLEIVTDCGVGDTSVGCSDDGTPPGNTGSRVEVQLTPGETYYIHVDGYSAQYVGPFTLSAEFYADCQPQCDGNFCLENGCGEICNKGCPAGSMCEPAVAQCFPEGCLPDCDNKECGPDGCGGVCGTCPAGDYCSFDLVGEDEVVVNLGQCVTPPPCDNFNTVCQGCASNEWCGANCECHSPDEDLPDLTATISDISLDHQNILETSCSYFEKCSPYLGRRKLLRFTVRTINLGYADMISPQPKELPEYFQYSTCHGHWHFRGYAIYSLYDQRGQIIEKAGKESYCLEDSGPVVKAPWVECSPAYDCGHQGVQRGWTDEYGSSLDCQWLDVTDVPDGIYRLELIINANLRLQEVSLDNNYAEQIVEIKGDKLTLLDDFPGHAATFDFVMVLASFVMLALVHLM